MDNNIYSNPNKQINNLIKSIEGYINRDKFNKIIRNKYKNNKKMPNNLIYKNNYNSFLKLKLKEDINIDNSLNNNTEKKIKIKK